MAIWHFFWYYRHLSKINSYSPFWNVYSTDMVTVVPSVLPYLQIFPDSSDFSSLQKLLIYTRILWFTRILNASCQKIYFLYLYNINLERKAMGFSFQKTKIEKTHSLLGRSRKLNAVGLWPFFFSLALLSMID